MNVYVSVYLSVWTLTYLTKQHRRLVLLVVTHRCGKYIRPHIRPRRVQCTHA